MDIPGFDGLLVTPEHPEYEASRAVWNGVIDRRPAVIARCTNTSDVAAAIRFARQRDLIISVRGGGHGVSGAAMNNGGLVVDCSGMKAITVDPQMRVARAEAGVLWGEFDAATQAYGLATTGGIVTHTGIAGLTLGGGIGWLMRKFATTADNLIGADVVTAGGERLRASEDENEDLFFGLRGAGANFGVVTSFEYRLHELGPTVLAGPVVWALEDAPEVLRFLRHFVIEAPDELTTIAKVGKLPPLPIIPEELRGRPFVQIGSCWAGRPDDGEIALKPLRAFGRPLLDLVAEKPYVANQAANDPTVPHGWHYYWKSTDITGLEDGAIDGIVEHATAIESPRSYALIFQLGGALARIDEDATAYSHRSAAFNVNINGVWLPDEPIAEQEIAWTRGFFDALEPWQAGVYVNFLGEEGEARVRTAYGEAKYGRLVALKDRFDPDNVFRMNQNITPSH